MTAASIMSDENFAKVREAVKRAFDEVKPIVIEHYAGRTLENPEATVAGVTAQVMVNCIFGETQDLSGNALVAAHGCGMGIGAAAGMCFQSNQDQLGEAILFKAADAMMSFAKDVAEAMDPQGSA